MLVRIRSKDGNFRVEVNPQDDISVLVNKIIETSPSADPATIAISNQPRGNETLVKSIKGTSLAKLGVAHGALIFVTYKPREAEEPTASVPSTSNGTASTSTSEPRPWELVKEDTIDTYWRSQNGQIPRGRDSRFCKHSLNGMCDYCTPLEPYDPAYHKEQNIKHLSYHAYLKKLTSKTSGPALPPLETISYKVKSPCPVGGHAPWPASICTACQPSAITLQSQSFRMVDHLEIASTQVIDSFLDAWRATGMQRFGWMVGRYEAYDKVPMGIKAVVEAIYEPPQQGELDGLTLGIPWEDEPRLKSLLQNASTPLSIVGLIFTDLDPTPEDRTKNVYKRHPGSFYLSSLEAIFSATMQKRFPTASRSSPTGEFSSRLVTAVLTGTQEGGVDVSAYQVTEQACAMVEADMIEASVDPNIVRVKEEDRSQDSARYVPDVFFTYKNEYGLEVKKSAKPAFPVEYLLVTLTHGFPQSPSPLFRSTKFPIENRAGLANQTVDRVLSLLASIGAPDLNKNSSTNKLLELASCLSDLHLIAFLDTTQLMSPHDMKILFRVITSPKLFDDTKLLGELFETDGWQTLMTFTREAGSSSSRSAPGGFDEDIPQDVLDQIAAEEAASRETAGSNGSSSAGVKVCPHCTFENPAGGTDCDVCGLPLG